MSKGKAEIEQGSGWSSCSREEVRVSLVWSWPLCCDEIVVALKGLPRVGRQQNVWANQEINEGRNISWIPSEQKEVT